MIRSAATKEIRSGSRPPAAAVSAIRTEDTPGPARRLAEHLGNVVRAATAGQAGTAWMSALPCRCRPARRRCPGRMTVLRPEPSAPIGWQCSICGDEGVISNWEDSPYDLRRRRLTLAGPINEVVISEETAAALRLLDPDCERVVFGMRAHDRGAVVFRHRRGHGRADRACGRRSQP